MESNLEEMQSVYQIEVHVHYFGCMTTLNNCIRQYVYMFMYNGIVLFCRAYTKEEKMKSWIES